MEEADIVRKDMGDYYTQTLARIMDEIDEVKKSMILNKVYVPLLNERLHSLFVKLAGKLNEKEVKQQYQFATEIGKIPITYTEKVGDSYRTSIRTVLRNDLFPQYRMLLEQREIHLNQCMERLGLTNIQREKRKVR